MYPDWPESDADLVPLPQCDGPKLKPFKFSGPRKIEFLEYAGEGTHAHVFKVNIEGDFYAIKVFRWTEPDEWPGPESHADENDREAVMAFSNHTEPFSCECRAFARLQESGHEELAIRCFGYILVNEEEKEMVDRFKVNFDSQLWGCFEEYKGRQRARFLGKRTGRQPPLRGIVKAFGQADPTLKLSVVKKLFRAIVRLHQLGIVGLDVADRQLVDGKMADLSQALTSPNFIMTPELNPFLSSEEVAFLENETFRYCRSDFARYEDAIWAWNDEHEDAKDRLWIQAFSEHQYNLRKVPSRDDRPYTFADPRLYDWKKSSLASESADAAMARGEKGQRSDGTTVKIGGSRESDAKKQRRLNPYPTRWYYDCDEEEAAQMRRFPDSHGSLNYEYRGGLIFPTRDQYRP